MKKIKHLHYKDINGLRFIAFITIFLFSISFIIYQEDQSDIIKYFYDYSLALKEVGLVFFFFLSSFLITSQALREYKYKHKFSLKKYYIRRALRILPVLLIALIFYYLLHPQIINTLKLNSQLIETPTKYLLFFPYYSDKYSPEVFIYTFHIWTIMLLISFYFVWGIILKLFNKAILPISILLVILGIAAPLYLNFDNLFHFNILYYLYAFGSGAILAKLIREKNDFLSLIKNLSLLQTQFIYIVNIIFGLVILAFAASPLVVHFLCAYACLFFSFILLEQTYSKQSWFKFRNSKVLTVLGKISYGLIIFSPIVAVLLFTAIESIEFNLQSTLLKILFPIITFVITWLFSDFFYNTIENYIYRIKRDFKNL